MQGTDPGREYGADTASWYGWFTFAWLTPLLERGVTQPIRAAPPLLAADNPIVAGDDYVQAIGSGADSTKVLRTLAWNFRWQIAALQICFMMQHAFGLLSPLILQRILVFQELNQHPEKEQAPGAVQWGIMAIQFYICLEAFRIVFNTQVGWWRMRINLRMNSALCSLIFHRSLNRQGETATGSSTGASAQGGEDGSDGAIYNVIASDVQQHIEALFTMMHAWLWPVTVTTAALLLYHQIGPAAYPGVMAMVALQLLQFALQSVTGFLRQPYLEAKDVRMSRLSEAMVHVRAIRLAGWPTAAGAHVQEARTTEMRYLAAREYLTSVTGGLQYVHATLVALVVLTYFVHTDAGSASFKASLVLPVLGLLAQVNGPIGAVPHWLVVYIEYRNATWRLQEYIRGKGAAAEDDGEMDQGRLGEHLVSVNAEFSHTRQDEGESGSLVQQGFTLRAAFEVARGEVVFVNGPAGSGKSTLVGALLGEVPRLRGVIRTPVRGAAAPTPVSAAESQQWLEGNGQPHFPQAQQAYCPQRPWIFSGTVRENILFGAPFDRLRFKAVTHACALDHDLSIWPDGDETEMCGATVSGGQRQRIALARCVYRALSGSTEKMLVLIDDALSAVDAQVSQHIVHALLGPSGLLVRPHLSVVWTGYSAPGHRCLTLAAGDVVDDKVLPAAEQYLNPQDDDAPRPAPRPAQPIDQPIDQPAAQTLGRLRDFKEEKKPGQKSKLYSEETAETGYVAWSTYWSYVELVGPWTTGIILLSIGGIMVSQQCVDLFLAYWTDEHPEKNFLHKWVSRPVGTLPSLLPLGAHGEPTVMLTTYTKLVIVFVCFNFLGFLLEVYGGLRAARSSFSGALTGCLQRPFGWWDSNPTGRVLNRFQQDQNTVDATITRMIGVITGAIFYFIGHTVFLSIVNPLSVLLLPFTIFAIEKFAARLYRPNIREIQRMCLMAASPYYHHILEALRGQATIRAFDSTRPMQLDLMLRLGDVQRTQFLKQSLQQWVNIRLSAIAFLLSMMSSLSPVLQYYGVMPVTSAGLVGFAIMYSQQLDGILGQLVHNFSDLEMQLVSLERLNELADVPEDKRLPLPATSQELAVRNVSVRYRLDMPYALQGVTFTIHPREKVALIGRTGSGKSSMLLCLLGAIPHEGEVLLGGQSVGQHKSSSKIGLVPQEAIVFKGSLRFNVDPNGEFSDRDIWTVLRKVQLTEKFLEDRFALVEEVGQLSAAEAQQLGLARVLLRTLEVVLLDEVTATLHAAAAERMVQMVVRELERSSVVMVTHQEKLTDWCSRTIKLEHGRVVA